MPTNVFFNNYKSRSEQGLLEDLIIESIRQYGMDVYYLPRAPIKHDALYGEDTIKAYRDNLPVEMYIKNIQGFGGQGDFMSKFGLEIRDTMTLTVASKRFSQYVGQHTGFTRPREGDLIYFPLNDKIFEIKFVEHEDIFYQMGALHTYDLKCELFEYNNEIFETGLEYVDVLQPESSMVTDINSPVEVADPMADNAVIQDESNSVIDFNEQDPFSEGSY